MIACKDELDEIDGRVGDGDCGSTLARGGRALLSILADNKIDARDAAGSLGLVADAIGEAMGGTSG
eukprot:7110288-Ditylum_brightwellii.AAC.1